MRMPAIPLVAQYRASADGWTIQILKRKVWCRSKRIWLMKFWPILIYCFLRTAGSSYLKLCRPALFVRSTQLLSHPEPWPWVVSRSSIYFKLIDSLGTFKIKIGTLHEEIYLQLLSVHYKFPLHHSFGVIVNTVAFSAKNWIRHSGRNSAQKSYMYSCIEARGTMRIDTVYSR